MLEKLRCLQAPVRQVSCNTYIVKPGSTAHLELRDSHWTVIQTVTKTLKPIKINLATFLMIVKFNVY